jgi:hypothetical protein
VERAATRGRARRQRTTGCPPSPVRARWSGGSRQFPGEVLIGRFGGNRRRVADRITGSWYFDGDLLRALGVQKARRQYKSQGRKKPECYGVCRQRALAVRGKPYSKRAPCHLCEPIPAAPVEVSRRRATSPLQRDIKILAWIIKRVCWSPPTNSRPGPLPVGAERKNPLKSMTALNLSMFATGADVRRKTEPEYKGAENRL